ncbi:hypothetical protein SAMN03159343_1361 [Klenkia marina]|uniref:ABC transporter n=1 Tax=Klenkia marina TaxID=1960309 RepID=A0A1G4XSZ6_9ACTN|nr:hypothetical protein [Klenkia marina]SCX44140.1 hypothetical protein SAMN03159343_1361 [Klenkia marina]
MPLKLPVASVVALAGPDAVRAAVCAALDEDSARCSAGHANLRVARLGARPGLTLAERMTMLAEATTPVVLVDRLTDGLTSTQRRTVLAGLRALADRGATVVVDDADPVAALAVADAALRVDATGRVELEELPDVAALLAG